MIPERDPMTLYVFLVVVILFFMGYAAWAIRSGSFHLKYGVYPISRRDEPIKFWLAVIVIGIVVPVVIVIAAMADLRRMS